MAGSMNCSSVFHQGCRVIGWHSQGGLHRWARASAPGFSARLRPLLPARGLCCSDCRQEFALGPYGPDHAALSMSSGEGVRANQSRSASGSSHSGFRSDRRTPGDAAHHQAAIPRLCGLMDLGSARRPALTGVGSLVVSREPILLRRLGRQSVVADSA